jgi:hypothetical protein
VLSDEPVPLERLERGPIAENGVTPEEAEGAGRRWPRKIGDDKLMVQGRGTGDRFVQVVNVIDPRRHSQSHPAMPLTGRRRRR